ncbi:MAG: hypothetical protein RJA09_1739 [Pseudomonadota bacterium]|jgi:DNA-binding transcriptional LysR family regulator
MQLHNLDLNLLVVFNQLLTDRRVSRAADSLGVSQPAISNALARLRKTLGDELFVRTAQGMEPTPYAEQMAEAVAQALGLIQGAVQPREGFDPLTSQRTFTVAMTDIGEIYFLPGLMTSLAQAAPGVAINTARHHGGQLADDMREGRVDLAIGLLPQLQAGFFQQRLFEQRYVCLFRQGHPWTQQGPTLQTYQACDHVVVAAAGTGHHQVDSWLAQQGIQRRVRLTVPHFVAVGHILQNTDLVATVPERLAERVVGPFGLATAPHPAPLPDMAINLFWHARYHREPGNQWLRQHLFQRFGAP